MYKDIINDNIDENTIFFNNPKKINGIYIAPTVNKVSYRLNKLEILKTGQNEKKQYEIWYKINLNTTEGVKLCNFLYMLDNIALDTVAEKSPEWLNDKLSRDYLEKKYIPPYDDDIKGNIYLKLNIFNKNLLSKFNEEHICEICIEGLEFYKNKFKYLLIISNVISKSKFDLESKFDFIKSIETKSLNNQPKIKSKKKVITKEIINELADNSSVSSIEDDNKSILSRLEIETIITETRKEANQCLINAKRARIAADKLREKAIEKSQELRKCENLLKNK